MHPAAPSGARSDPRTTRRTAVRVALLLALPCALLVALVAARWTPLMDLDTDWARATHRQALADPGLTHANRVLTDRVWDPWTMRALAVLAALWWGVRGAWRPAVWLLVTVVCGALVQQGVKAAVARPRPVWRHPVDTAHYAAFPSGHAMTATVVCGALLWLLYMRHGRGPLWWTASGLAVVSVAGVGLTRVWLGVHWPSDVLGGWLLGALTVAVAVALAPGAADHGRERPPGRP
ncbi:phosphatase PAP2 family protein [Streptomyces odontomachi]|uniref:phosphatase PAP2 family protein n=1 Tax=Streptomyces odontomachi TaxID=2944940 RepID=UPI00210BEBBD|nr:phosphatase PAP2 family protein [Streptomyces sp. ODS25]